MADLGSLSVKEFSLLDILTYFIPGAVALFAMYAGGCFTSVLPAVPLNAVLETGWVILGSYLAGHALHYPAVLVGRCVQNILGSPVKYLLDITPGPDGWRKKLRKDFSPEYKDALRSALKEYWAVGRPGIDRTLPAGQYYALSEALLEQHYTNAWVIHERFYITANLMRALVVPVASLAVVTLGFSKMLAILLFLCAMVFAYRFHLLNIEATKQIYNGFYLYYRVQLSDKTVRNG